MRCRPAAAREGCAMDKPPEPEALIERGRSYARRAEFAPAIDAFTEALELDAARGDAWFERGNCHTAVGDVEGAIVDFTQAIELEPINPVYYAARAGAQIELDRFDLAI